MGAEHFPASEDCGGELECVVEACYEVFADNLRIVVWSPRIKRKVFCYRQFLGGTEDVVRGNVDEPFDLLLSGHFEHVECAEAVDPVAGVWVLY